MENFFQSGFEAEKLPSDLRERLLQNLLSDMENTKGKNKNFLSHKVDLLFLVCCLASIGVISYGFIFSEQTWANLIQ